MQTTQRPACYGSIFPDFSRLQFNVPCKGKAYSATLESSGIGVQSSRVDVDAQQWERCVACPRYRDCYDLSLGRLLVQQTVHSHGG